MKLRLIAGSLILFVLGLGFNGFFTLTSFDKLYVESIISQYRVIGKDFQRSIENGLRYGKGIQNFTGIERLLARASRDITQKISGKGELNERRNMKFRETDISLYVALTNGEILYSDNENDPLRRLPQEALLKGEVSQKEGKSLSKSNYIKHGDSYITVLPVRDENKDVAGIIAISFKEKQLQAFLEGVFDKNIRPIIIISGCGILLLVLLLHLLVPARVNMAKFPKKKIYLVIFLIVGSAQILTTGLSTIMFKEHFLRVNKENTEATNEVLKRNLEYLLEKGVRIERIWQLELYLRDIISASPEIGNITLFDHRDQPLYRATKEKVTDFQRSKEAYQEWVVATRPVENPEYNARTSINHHDKLEGYFSSNTSKDILFDKLIDTLIDSITVMVVSILFFIEMLILIFKYIEREGDEKARHSVIHYGVMRPAAFLFLFGIDLSISFLPLHMETLYVPIFGLSRDTIMGLPISMEFLFVGISILISGVWLDRRGWHEPFIVGLFVAGLGILYSWMAPDAVHFIISRGVVGLGYGLSLMASQGFVITYSDWKSKAQALAHLFAGIYAGSICGGATGGMLAEWMGYKPVFLIGALILFAVMGYTFLFMRHGMKKPEIPVVEKVKEKLRFGRIFNFLTDRTVLGLVFFSSFPAAIAVVGFLNYFSPIYLNRIGASQSTIGQILMIYGICLIYFGPFLSRYVDASDSKKTFIFLGCALGSLALVSFHVLGGITAAIVAVFLLGLSSSFVLAAQSAYALELKVTKELGEGKAIGIFRSTSRIGQMLGPIVFSSVIVSIGTTNGITFLGGAYLLTAFLFLLTTQKSDKKEIVMEHA
ncbi:MFS transporter [Thermodesulfobacteriota bacterium]